MEENKFLEIKKNIISRINKIKNNLFYKKMFKIIFDNKINYIKNDNGILFNINEINNKILLEIDFLLNEFEINNEKYQIEFNIKFNNINTKQENNTLTKNETKFINYINQ